MLFVIATIVFVFRSKSSSIRKPQESIWTSSCKATSIVLVFGLLTVAARQANAQPNPDHSVLAFDGGQRSYSAKVELESEPKPASSQPSFHPRPIDGGKYLPPAPPANMLAPSNSNARFRVPGSGTLTAAPKPPELTMKTSVFGADDSLRPGPDDDDEISDSKTASGNDSGTFATNRPVTIQRGFQAPSVQNSTDRFGKFGAGPDSSTSGSDRFAPRARLASNRTLPRPPQTSRVSASDLKAPESAAKTSTGTSAGPPPPLRPQALDNAGRKSPVKQPAIGPGFGNSQPQIERPGDRFKSDPSNTGGAFTAPANQQKPQAFVSPAAKQVGNGFSKVGSSQNQTAASPLPDRKPFVSPGRFSAPLGAQPQSSDFGGNGMLPRTTPGTNRPSNNMTGQPEVRPSNSFGPPNPIGRPASNSRASLRDAEFGQPRTGAGTTPAIASSASNSLREPKNYSSGLTPARSSLRSPISSKPLKSIRVSEEPIAGATSAKEKSVFQRTSTQTRPGSSPQTEPARKAANEKSVVRSEIEFAKSQFTEIQALSARGNGTPIRLVEMFMQPLSPVQRKQMVSQYWESYYDLASLKIATDYQQWLDSIKTSNQVDEMLLSAARQMAADRRLAAEIQLGKSQSRLLDFMPNSPNTRGVQFFPVPADQPLIEQYVTDIEKYARVRNVPTSLRGIDPMLERTLTLITHRAATVAAAQKAANRTLQAISNRQATLASAVAAGKLWRDARMDMVASAVNYNQAISDFVLTLEPNRSPAQLSAFMLGTPKNAQPSAATRPRSVINPNPAFNGQPVRNAVNPAAWR
jgi:hypothetical protein